MTTLNAEKTALANIVGQHANAWDVTAYVHHTDASDMVVYDNEQKAKAVVMQSIGAAVNPQMGRFFHDTCTPNPNNPGLWLIVRGIDAEGCRRNQVIAPADPEAPDDGTVPVEQMRCTVSWESPVLRIVGD